MYVKFANRDRGFLMDRANGGDHGVPIDQGMTVQLWGGDRAGGANQNWRIQEVSSPWVVIRSREDERYCLDADMRVPQPVHRRVQVWGYDGPPPDDALWKFEELGGGACLLINKQSGLMLNAEGPETYEGSRLQLFGPTGGANEQWVPVPLLDSELNPLRGPEVDITGNNGLIGSGTIDGAHNYLILKSTAIPFGIMQWAVTANRLFQVQVKGVRFPLPVASDWLQAQSNFKGTSGLFGIEGTDPFITLFLLARAAHNEQAKVRLQVNYTQATLNLTIPT